MEASIISQEIAAIRLRKTNVYNPKINEIIITLGKVSVTNSLTASNESLATSASTKSAKLNASISKTVITINSQPSEPMSINFYFTGSDLTNNRLTKYHGFNSSVDISVFDQHNNEVEVSVDVSDPNRVTVDLGRLQVTGNWQIKIEK